MAKKTFTQEEKENIIYLYTIESLSAKKIGEKYNCSAPTILKNLREWNIPIKEKKIDLTNQRYGKLTVIKEAPPREDKYTRWTCQCDCGTICEIRGEYLRNGHTKSCGCEKNKYFYKLNLNGQKFGRLTVIKDSGTDSKKCICDCGNEVIVKTYNLINGNTQSCGCLQKDRASESNYIPLIGKKFGKLLVVKRVENNRYGHICYLCKCDCGGEIVVDSSHLRNGQTNSCGCIKSKGEMKIQQYLQENNIKYQAQYSFNDIFLSSGRRPFYDFAVLDENDKVKYIIEYQGMQHYTYDNNGWNNKENFIKTQRRDKEKKEALVRKGITLYEIPYWEIDNIEEILENIIKSDMEEAQEDVE